MSYFTIRNRCRSCDSTEYETFFQVNPIPVAGIYYDPSIEKTKNIFAPMTLSGCKSCGLIQLKETINPKIYDDYSFVGDSSSSYEEHLRWVASKIVSDFGINNKKVFEIGASNGILLKYIQDFGDNNVRGIEPSKKLCDYGKNLGINIYEGFFNRDYITHSNTEKFDCIIIRHVLEHIDDLIEMLSCLKDISKNEGKIIIEVPDIESVCDYKLLSNIFHEHLNYFSSDTLKRLLENNGFKLEYEQKVDIHGGSLFHVYRFGDNLIEKKSFENNFNKISSFVSTYSNYYDLISKKINSLTIHGKNIHGYGASHRTFILMANSGLNINTIPKIYDRNSFLQNKKLNGLHSQVKSPKEISNDIDAIVIFATSYENEIRHFLKEECKYNGEIISLKYEVLLNEF